MTTAAPTAGRARPGGHAKIYTDRKVTIVLRAAEADHLDAVADAAGVSTAVMAQALLLEALSRRPRPATRREERGR